MFQRQSCQANSAKGCRCRYIQPFSSPHIIKQRRLGIYCFPWLFMSLSLQALTKCALLTPEILRSDKSVTRGTNLFITHRPMWSTLRYSNGEREEKACWEKNWFSSKKSMIYSVSNALLLKLWWNTYDFRIHKPALKKKKTEQKTPAEFPSVFFRKLSPKAKGPIWLNHFSQH